MDERRKHSRKHYHLEGVNFYRDGDWVPVPQKAIQAVIVARTARGSWVPSFPALKPTVIGEDLAKEILEEARMSSSGKWPVTLPSNSLQQSS